MPLVINSLGGGHTYTHTNMHTYRCLHRINFKKQGTHQPQPGLKSEAKNSLSSIIAIYSLSYRIKYEITG